MDGQDGRSEGPRGKITKWMAGPKDREGRTFLLTGSFTPSGVEESPCSCSQVAESMLTHQHSIIIHRPASRLLNTLAVMKVKQLIKDYQIIILKIES